MAFIRNIMGLATVTALLLTGCTPDQEVTPAPTPTPPVSENPTPTPEPPPQQQPQPDPQEVRDGQGKVVTLLPETDGSGNNTAWYVLSGGVHKDKVSTEESLYANADVRAEDLDGDGKNEVLLTLYSTGTSGAQGMHVYKTDLGDYTKLFVTKQELEDSTTRYEQKYIGHSSVYFRDKETGLTATIQVDTKPLIDSGAQDVEALMNYIAPWVDPFFRYQTKDVNGDGVKEIIAMQRVIGVAHVHTIGVLKTTYYLENGTYHAKTLALYDEKALEDEKHEKKLAEVALK